MKDKPCSNCGSPRRVRCNIFCAACLTLYCQGKPVKGPFGIIEREPSEWPEEIVNEQDEAEEAGQLTLFAYSEKDPLL